ncbi:MAG: carbohydrate ABC transporter permease [Chloroflexi bacterium]|nr:carbohydrate ABC transporter permease [Chloroflexota bacterium]
MLMPAVWLISTSLKLPGAEMSFPPELIPRVVSWDNYPKALTSQPFLLFFRNTMLIVALNLVGVLLSASLAGYAFARLRFRFRSALFGLCLSTMMLPYVVTLIPTFIMFRVLGWTNTFLPLTVPAFFGGGAFNIFLFRQFFMTLPYELDEAARVDGASSLQIWWRIILPLSGPVLATVAIFNVVYHWNEFLMPLIFLNTPDRFTMALGLRMFQMSMGNYGHGQWALLMAASTSMIMPILVLFFAAQRYFMRGIVMTGLAGR